MSHAISVNDLLLECGLTDLHELRRLLLSNRLPQIRGDMVPKRDADLIVGRLTTHTIDWMRYKRRERDAVGDGPLRLASEGESSTDVSRWYAQIAPETLDDGESRALGVVCRGGYLEGRDSPEFVLRMNPGITVFLGDRGSGKSTVLALLSALSIGGTGGAESLSAKIADMFGSTPDAGERNRRARAALRAYGIDRYCLFFASRGEEFAYWVDVSTLRFDLRRRTGEEWTRETRDIGAVVAEVQQLRQGEVIRIAEDPDEQYITRLVCTLYPRLGERLDRFQQAYSAFVDLLDAGVHSRLESSAPVSERLFTFIAQNRSLLEEIQARAASATATREDVESLQTMLQFHDAATSSEFSDTIDALLMGPPDQYWRLFLARYHHTLRRRLPRLRLAFDAYARAAYDSWLDDDASPDSEEAEPRADDPGTVVPKESAAFFVGLHQTAEHLLRRLRSLSAWCSLYPDRARLDRGTTQLCNQAVALLRQKAELMDELRAVCQNLTDRIATVEPGVRVLVPDAEDSKYRSQETGAAIRSLMETAALLDQAQASHDARPITEAAARHRRALRTALSWLGEVVRRLATSRKADLGTAIEIVRKQGSQLRPMRQLSFGQKAGIILNVVLASAERPILVIDQPEDNLDAAAILQLAPTLYALRVRHQVIIATHNSNLVLGLPNASIVVMEGNGAIGYCRQAGTASDPSIVEAMIEVLEGGVGSFQEKIRLYESFVGVLAARRDPTLSLIEGTFRRRTIDALRNYLQPVLNHAELLKFARHEIKNQPHLMGDAIRGLQSDLRSTPHASDVSQRLDSLLGILDVGVGHLQGKIEEMRMLDTEARPTLVSLGVVWRRITSELLVDLRRRGRIVDVEIDESLDGSTAEVDESHLGLIIVNLLTNSFRATEIRASRLLDLGFDMTERVRVRSLHGGVDDDTTGFEVEDNGIGIPPRILPKLYHDDCTDQPGKGHGLGGVIVRKLLDLNRGSVVVIKSVSGHHLSSERLAAPGCTVGTVQRVLLSRGTRMTDAEGEA